MVLRRTIAFLVVFAVTLGVSWALIDLTNAEPPDPVPSIVLREEDEPDEDDPDPDPSPGDTGQTRTRGTRGADTASPPAPPPAGGNAPAPAPVPQGDDSFDSVDDGTD